MNATRSLMPVRSVVAIQIALVILIGWYWHSGWMALPRFVEGLMGWVSLISHLTLPVWGLAAAWWTRLRGRRLATLIGIQFALWFALMVALLPAVQ